MLITSDFDCTSLPVVRWVVRGEWHVCFGDRGMIQQWCTFTGNYRQRVHGSKPKHVVEPDRRLVAREGYLRIVCDELVAINPHRTAAVSVGDCLQVVVVIQRARQEDHP